MEREPVRFLDRELEGHLADVRERLGAFIGAAPDDLAFVANATTGVNTVLHSLRFAPGDELLTTDHEYNATLNALRHVAARDGARVVIARIPFPIASPDEAVDAILAAVTPRTRLALVSHVTSTTALVLPDRADRRASWPRGAWTPWSTRPTRRARCPWTSARSARPTRPATPTSGCARRRAPRSSTSGRDRRDADPAARR